MIESYIKYPDFKEKAVTLSYDDGVRQDKRLIGIMQKNGLKGTFNISCGKFSNAYEGVEKGKMTVEEALQTYCSSGMEVAAHGYKHMSLTHVCSELAINDIVSDRKELEKTFGCVIKGMAYANGAYNEEIIDLLRKIGINWARVTGGTETFDLPTDWMQWKGTCHHNHPRLMELAKAFVEEKPHWYYWARKLKLFYLWGHSYEFDNNDNWNIIEEYAEYIGNREDVWYATNGEIYEYLRACERLEVSIDGDFIYNPSAIDVYIDFLGKKKVILAGQTVQMK